MSTSVRTPNIKRTTMRQRFISALEYLLMLLLIMEFNTILHEYEHITTRLIYGAIIVTLLLCYLRKKCVKLEPILILFLIGAFLPFLNVSPGWEMKFIKLFVIILPVFVLYLKACLRCSLRDMLGPLLKFSNLVVLFAVISLFYWVFASNMEIIQPTIWIPNDWIGHERLIPAYHFVYFETQESTFMGYSTVRNSGMFEEAPMYNMILCTALAIETFIRTKCSLLRMFILYITVLTTFTTTGFIFLTLVSAWLLYRYLGKKFHSIMIIFVPLLLFGAYTVSSFIIEDKRNEKGGSGEGSFNSRMQDIENCIEIGLENPIIGQGLFTKRLSEEDGGVAAYGYSNSLFTLFADGGIYMVLLYLACLFFIPLQHYRRENKWPLAMLSFLLLFIFTASQYKLLTLWLMAVGLTIYSENTDLSYNKINED